MNQNPPFAHAPLPPISALFTATYRTFALKIKAISLIVILVMGLRSIQTLYFLIVSFFQPNGLLALFWVFLFGFIIWVGAFILNLWLAAAMFQLVSTEGAPSLDNVFQESRSKIWSFIWLSLLTSLVVFGGTFLLIIPGIYLGVLFSQSVWLLFAENRRGTDAIVKSIEYVRGYWWAIFGRQMLLTVIFLLITGVIVFLLFMAVGGSFQLLIDPSFQYSAVFSLLNTIFGFLVQFFSMYFLVYNFTIFDQLRSMPHLTYTDRWQRKWKKVIITLCILGVIIPLAGFSFATWLIDADVSRREAVVNTTAELRSMQSYIHLFKDATGRYPYELGEMQQRYWQSIGLQPLPYKYELLENGNNYRICSIQKEIDSKVPVICHTSSDYLDQFIPQESAGVNSGADKRI